MRRGGKRPHTKRTKFSVYLSLAHINTTIVILRRTDARALCSFVLLNDPLSISPGWTLLSSTDPRQPILYVSMSMSNRCSASICVHNDPILSIIPPGTKHPVLVSVSTSPNPFKKVEPTHIFVFYQRLFMLEQSISLLNDTSIHIWPHANENVVYLATLTNLTSLALQYFSFGL